MSKPGADPVNPPYANPNSNVSSYPPLNPAYPVDNNAYPPQAYPALNNPPQLGIVFQGPQFGQLNLNQPIAITFFGFGPTNAHCPNCNSDVTTRTYQYMGCMVWLMVLIFFIVSPCISCIPCCVKPWYDVAHFCPKCSHRIGTYALI